MRDGAVPDEKLGELMTGDNLGDDYKASFHRAADDAEESFAIPGAMDRMVKLPFGEMPAGVAVNIAIFDVTTHAWDLAKATGQSTDLDPEVLGVAYQVAQSMLTRRPARTPGMFGQPVAVPDDAPVADRLAGARRPHARNAYAARRRAATACTRPSASATAAFVTAPPRCSRPWPARDRRAVASATPWVASATAYGSVALVSAYVDVCGTAPGMLPTA